MKISEADDIPHQLKGDALFASAFEFAAIGMALVFPDGGSRVIPRSQ